MKSCTRSLLDIGRPFCRWTMIGRQKWILLCLMLSTIWTGPSSPVVDAFSVMDWSSRRETTLSSVSRTNLSTRPPSSGRRNLFKALLRPDSSRKKKRWTAIPTRLWAQDRADASAESSSVVPDKDQVLFLYNSLTRQKEPLRPVTPGRISLYTCGPTVYDFAHVGNFRAFLTYDVLKRVLLYLLGMRVDHVCNLTDVDDKIIQRANALGLEDVSELTRKYEQHFFDDLAALNIVPATRYPRATEHIPEMMDMIGDLFAKKLAYETPDGSWYFDTQRQETYGTQLVQLKHDEQQQQQSTDCIPDDDNAVAKRHFADFCLWKAFKDASSEQDSDNGVVADRLDAAWERPASSDGKQPAICLGRPGWHLECSAMVQRYFGRSTIDLHGGGVDLKFPHHENEIAQSEGVMNEAGMARDERRRFCNCWFHNGFVNLDNEKMSKSLGNFLTLRTACPSALAVRAYRYLVVSSHYRNPLAFTPAAMEAAQNAVSRIDKVTARLEAVIQNKDNKEASGAETNGDLVQTVVPQAMENFRIAVLDDLSMPRAAASLFALIKAAEGEFKRVAKESDETAPLDVAGLSSILEAVYDMDRVFGILYKVPATHQGEGDQGSDNKDEEAVVPSNVLDLVSQRTAAKEAKDWELADDLRARITELGFTVKDVKGGDPIVTPR